MSANHGVDTQETINKESPVCDGDGTTCVECGKVFTHPFYFSTHISSHTSEKGFVVIGQCALCGLVFSDATVFAAHLNSSETRLEKQVAPQEQHTSPETCSDVKSKVTSRVAAVVKKKAADIKLEIIDQEDIKVENHSPQPGEVKASGTEITDTHDEARGKRKRKAPQRFEIDLGPQLATSRVAADPEVEAYLLSLKQMGLTVDPEAFSSGGKRRRKISEGSGGKGRGRKEFLLAEDLTGDVLMQQKPSPKYEYLDSDDSFDEDPEVLPESGKMTRGQRLQQRQERLSQGKGAGADKKPDIVKLEVTSDAEKDAHDTNTTPGTEAVDQQNNKAVPLTTSSAVPMTKSSAVPMTKSSAVPMTKSSAVPMTKSNAVPLTKSNAVPLTKSNAVPLTKSNAVPLTKSNVSAVTAVKRAQPTPTPGLVVKREKPTVAAPYFAGSVGRVPQVSSPRGRVRGALTQPTTGRLNTVKANHMPPFAGRNNQFRGNHTPMFAGRNNQYRAFSVPNTGNSNVYQPRSAVANNSGPRPLRFPQGQMRERKGDAVKLPAAMNVQKSNSLEDLKKNSRDNVEMMLQSVGMIAVTSSAMGQGKIFGSEKANLYPPVRNTGASNIRQASHPYGSFLNKPFSSQKSLPSQQPALYRGQARFGAGPRGRLPAHPQPYRGNPAVQPSPGQGFGVGTQRGRGQHLNSTMRGSVRGRGSNPPARGHVMSATNSVRPVAASRGGAGLVNKQSKPFQASGDVIVIDDDEIQEIAAGSSESLAGTSRVRNTSPKVPKSSPARDSKVTVSILDVDMDNLSSDIKIIEDKTHGLSSPAGSADLQDNTSLEQPLHDDVGNDDDDVGNNDDDVESKDVGREKSNDSPKVEIESLEEDADAHPAGGNDSCQDKIVEEVDILPGEDIDGWKVCLAEDSDSNDDTASPRPSTSKASASNDHHLSLAGSPEDGCSFPQHAEAAVEDLKEEHSSCQPSSDLSQNVEHNDRETQDDEMCQSVSATAESQVEEKVSSESQNGTKHDPDSEMVCHEQQDVCSEDIKAITVSDPGLVPDDTIDNEKDDIKSESSGSIKSTLLEDGKEADIEDVLEKFKNENSSLHASHTASEAEVYTEDADTCMQTALSTNTAATSTKPVIDSTAGGENQLFTPNGSDDSSVVLLPDNAALADEETGSYNGASTGLADCETGVEENCVTNIDFETSSAVTLPESGILVANIEPALSCTYASNASSSDPAEVDSIAPSSESNMSLENDNARSHVDNKSNSETDAGSVLLPVSSSNTVTSENNVESEHTTVSSHSPPSHQCPTAAAECLRDDSNLLDIFTEIEKTCKEMEQTLDSEAEKSSGVITEKIDVTRVVSDLSTVLEGAEQEEKDFNGVLKVADRSNGVAFSEARSDGGMKESRSGDCRYSDMIYEKEVVDSGHVSGTDEEHNKNKHVEKEDVAGDEYGM